MAIVKPPYCGMALAAILRGIVQSYSQTPDAEKLTPCILLFAMQMPDTSSSIDYHIDSIQQEVVRTRQPYLNPPRWSPRNFSSPSP